MKKINFLLLVMVIVLFTGVAFARMDGFNWNDNQNTNENKNTNENRNTNTNLNTNYNRNDQSQGQAQLQGQAQIQAQGQLQGQGQDQKTDVSIDSHDVNIDRRFPTPGFVPLPGTNVFYQKPTQDSSFRNIREIIKDTGYDRFTEGVMNGFAKGGKVTVHYQLFQGSDVVKRIGPEKDGDKWIKVVYKLPKGFIPIAVFDGEAVDGKTNSINVLGACGEKAIEDGVNILYIKKESEHRMVEASGWGIGGYGTGATVGSDGTFAGLVGGGTGYSKNKAGTEDRPWIQGYAGIIR